jgi:hypothetical protein
MKSAFFNRLRDTHTVCSLSSEITQWEGTCVVFQNLLHTMMHMTLYSDRNMSENV